MRSVFVKTILPVLSLVLLLGPPMARAEPDAFIDELITVNGSLDIGERTAFSPPSPPIPPTAAQNGPISAGTVRGQFDWGCGDGPFPACPDAAWAAATLNWKWGVLQVSDYSNFPGSLSAQFLEVNGKTLFGADPGAPNEGFTFVETQGFDLNPFTRLAHFEFNLENADGTGLSLQPGYSYVIFALLSEFPIPNRVPGEGAGSAEESIFQSAFADGPPFQFHQGFIVFDPTGNTNELATSRLIPVVPEPGMGFLAFLSGMALVWKRPRKPARLL